jgi:hypothetical protein
MRAVDSFLIITPAMEIRFKPLFSVERFYFIPASLSFQMR